jgi:hypothetical protein
MLSSQTFAVAISLPWQAGRGVAAREQAAWRVANAYP